MANTKLMRTRESAPKHALLLPSPVLVGHYRMFVQSATSNMSEASHIINMAIRIMSAMKTM